MSLINKLKKKKTKEKEDNKKPTDFEDKKKIKSQKEESAQPELEVTSYSRESLIKRPFLSEKSSIMTADHNKYVFETKFEANKKLVKDEIETRYGVKVKSVNIVRLKGKPTSWRGHKGKNIKRKKAVVTLMEGQKIDIG